MNNILIGREKEKNVLKKALLSPGAEMISVIGRRRVGKTYLISTFYKDLIDFELTGIQNRSMHVQLQNFANQLAEVDSSSRPIVVPKNWQEAFLHLKAYLQGLRKRKKIVLFFDELPWLATRRSDFLSALGYFWNSWAVKHQIVVVLCGSAASWMIRKVVHEKGGLYNRITRRIYLEPFNLYETEAFLNSLNLHFDRYQIVQLYMALGGVPHYLKVLHAGRSAVENIDHIFFSKTGLLKNEFANLYYALFEKAEKHIEIIQALGSKRKGLSRKEIVSKCSFSDGGSVNRVLEELEYSGFISTYQPFGKKKKGILFRLTDEFSLFYLSFIANKGKQKEGSWRHLSQTQAYKSWSGYAFESVCLKHIPQIKKALGISGIYSKESSYIFQGDEYQKGFQLDLLIERNDHVINIFEIKFNSEQVSIAKNQAKEWRLKIAQFKANTRTRKQVFLNYLTTFGLFPTKNSIGLVDQAFSMDILFEKD